MADILEMNIDTNQLDRVDKLKKIREQIEFYLSDSNVRKDKFIQKLLCDEDDKLVDQKYINLEQFLKFNRIKHLTSEIIDLKSALRESNSLELSKDEASIRRRCLINFEKNIDKCTVYIEKLTGQVDHDWLKNLFTLFGRVTHVSLPKFKETGELKGFAFIEFEDEETTSKVCTFFRLLDQKKHSESNECDEFDTTANRLPNDTLSNSLSDDTNLQNKNRKRLIVDVDNQVKRVKKENDTKIDDKNDFDILFELLDSKYESKMDCILGLRVISKAEWMAYKKEYLILKKKLDYQAEKSKKSIASMHKATETITESKAKRNKSERQIDMQPGLIVKLKYSESKITEEESLIKKFLREIDGEEKTIEYIDVQKERNQCFIRFKDKESAIICIEEKNYWSFIMQSMLDKIKKKSRKDERTKSNHNGNSANYEKNNQPESDNHSVEHVNDYNKGWIIRLQMDIDLNDEPSEQELKKQIRNSTNGAYLAYIDLNTTVHNLFLSSEMVRKSIFIRSKSAECTKKIMEDERFKALGESIVLEGDDESEYWQHINDVKCSQRKHPHYKKLKKKLN